MGVELQDNVVLFYFFIFWQGKGDFGNPNAKI